MYIVTNKYAHIKYILNNKTIIYHSNSNSKSKSTNFYQDNKLFSISDNLIQNLI